MSNQQDLTTPMVHLNGSGFKNLEEQYREGLQAVEDAIQKLPVPHGRDYYVQDDGAYLKARAQFEGQLQKLNEVQEELTAILRAVYRQERGTR